MHEQDVWMLTANFEHAIYKLNLTPIAYWMATTTDLISFVNQYDPTLKPIT